MKALSFLSRVSLPTKIALLTVAGIGLLCGGLVLVVSHQVGAELQAQAQARQESNMRVASEVLRGAGELRLVGDRLMAGARPLDGDTELVDRVQTLVGGVATVFRGDTRVATNVRKPDGDRAVGTKLVGPAHDAVLVRGQPYRGEADILGEAYFTAYDPIKDASGATVGVLFVGLKKSAFLSMLDVLIRSIALQALVAAAVIGGLLYAVLRWQIRPLVTLSRVMGRLQEGDHAVAVPSLDRGDEIGLMARAVEVFKEHAVARERLEAEQKVAEARAAEQRKADMVRLADHFEQAVGGIIGAVSASATELEATATTLTRTADVTRQKSATVTAASGEASSNVQAVAAATNEMTASIGEISRQVQTSSRIADAAVSQAAKTDDRIGALSIAASRIGDVVKLITDIAEQTNLLALNATIEAARAGEAGKGFAVVANEVKALAGQTAKATGEISAQIAAMQAATEDSVSAIKEISGTIGQIAEVASAIAAAVEEQGAAAAEISRNIQQAAHGTTEVAQNITEVSRGAEDTGAASSELLNAAGQLALESNQLRTEVQTFLASVRAA
ncbi:methyl-accepting chemotaxis protein [Rhodoplanes azumiensis]|uniref:Methyl-accepting chemotaxis protein n=1 Tax=Rhodoplanes azumiensis TaxID=1897628 RepID=A0ABW5AC92_9BRAD